MDLGAVPADGEPFTASVPGGITMPTAPIVISVEGHGDLEWQLFFDREG